MARILRYFLVLVAVMFAVGQAQAQDYRTYKVKKKDTLYGIAHSNGLTVEQLAACNPGMEQPGYVLKKGDMIMVPVMDKGINGDVRQRAIRLGVMLPLNDASSDGKRMLEYYRGVLMACDSLKKDGISVDVQAWDLPEDGSLQEILNTPQAANRDLIIGPFYEKFIQQLSAFANMNGIKLVIPFSINTMETFTNQQVYQIYQNHNDLNESTARRFSEWFRTYHPIIIDGGDKNSTKGAFTSILRNQLTEHGVQYNVTSLKTPDHDFARAFAANMPNIVVINTANQAALVSTFAKLTTLKKTYPDVRISLFGYLEWMPYTEQHLTNFHKFNVYLPAPFYTNLDTPLAQRLQQKYKANFNQDMINILPKFALTGFDHTVFFLRGLHKYGESFDGTARGLGFVPSQTPLNFERLGNGGYQNRSYMFIHYKPEGTIETITY